jgi:hypothetical protein
LDDWRHLLHQIEAEPDKMTQHLDKTNGNAGDIFRKSLFFSVYQGARLETAVVDGLLSQNFITIGLKSLLGVHLCLRCLY